MPLLYSHSLPLRHVSIVRVGIGKIITFTQKFVFKVFVTYWAHADSESNYVMYLSCTGFIVNKRINLKLLGLNLLTLNSII